MLVRLPELQHTMDENSTGLLRMQGQHEFEVVSRNAFLHELGAVLTRRDRSLLAYGEVVRAARLESQVDRGEREIPISQIRGSENRTRDFDAQFLPASGHIRERWVRLYTLMQQGREMPPIEVYELGGLYYVKDGHHRVSVARRLGWETIRAQVIEVQTRAPLGAGIEPEDSLKLAEYAGFLDRTQLDRQRPDARLDCSNLGRYDVIFEHILGHRYFLSVEAGEEVSVPHAAASWYDSVYRPVMDVARRHRLAEELPGWTDADIYLALTRLWLDLDREGQPADPEHAAEKLLSDAGQRRGRTLGRRRRDRARRAT
jgi:uncharacterized ParB-like nuclease family protein